MTINRLVVDNESLGKMYLCDILPYSEYKNGKKLDGIYGYKYIVALPKRGFEKLNVKIPGDKLMETPKNGFFEVKFENLIASIYTINGKSDVTAKATNIFAVTD